MALSRFRRYVARNKTGVNIVFDSGGRVEVIDAPWFVNTTTGKLVEVTPTTFSLLSAGQTLTDNAEAESVEIDNTSDLFLGTRVSLKITHDGGTAADGTVDLYLSSGVTTTNLQTNQSGYDDAEKNKLRPIGSLTWHADGLNGESMLSNEFNLG